MEQQEIYFIKLYESQNPDIGYNISDGGYVPRLSGEYNPSKRPEVRKKLKEKLTGRKILWKDKIIKTTKEYEKNLTDEQRKQRSEKLSFACAGEKNGMYGKKHSDATKGKMSLKMKERLQKFGNPGLTEEANEKRRNHCWVHDEIQSYYISKDLLEQYLTDGYILGRINVHKKDRR